MHIFRLFASSNLLGYISELRRNSLWERCHNPCIGSILWCTSHTTSTSSGFSLKPNCHLSSAKGVGSNTFVTLQMANC